MNLLKPNFFTLCKIIFKLFRISTGDPDEDDRCGILTNKEQI